MTADTWRFLRFSHTNGQDLCGTETDVFEHVIAHKSKFSPRSRPLSALGNVVIKSVEDTPRPFPEGCRGVSGRGDVQSKFSRAHAKCLCGRWQLLIGNTRTPSNPSMIYFEDYDRKNRWTYVCSHAT